MKAINILYLVVLFSTVMTGQNQPKTGPIIKDYGAHFSIESADLLLETNKQYKVLFDVFTDHSSKSKINPLINTVARYINMHAAQGVPLSNMKIAVVLHGQATRSALSEAGYTVHFGRENPDFMLINELAKANVEVFVCGQSFLANKFNPKELSDQVKMALSAMTVLSDYQQKDYQIINFN